MNKVITNNNNEFNFTFKWLHKLDEMSRLYIIANFSSPIVFDFLIPTVFFVVILR